MPSDAFEAYWNAWIEADGKAFSTLTGGEVYDAVLDLGKISYEPTPSKPESKVGSAPVSKSVTQAMIEAVKKDKKKLKLTVRAILLNDAIELPENAVTAGTIEIDLAKLIALDKRARQKNADKSKLSQLSDEELQRLSKEFSLAKFSVPIVANKVTQCAQIAFSVWDAGSFRPLDHIVYTFPVIEDDGVKQAPQCDVPRIQGGFGAMAGALSSTGTSQVDAALHLFEFAAPNHESKTKAVYIDVNKYRGSTPGTDWKSRGVYTWELESSLSRYLSEGEMLEMISVARERKKYDQVANDLQQKLFPDNLDDKYHQASMAFESLANLKPSAGSVPTVLVRAIASTGKHLYLPLSVLEAGGKVKNPFNVIYPLPRENYIAAPCIGKWTLGYPEKISLGNAVPDELPFDPTSMSLPPNRMTRLRNFNDLKCYFRFDAKECKPALKSSFDSSKSEALLLLAHQDEGAFWFTKDKVSGDWPKFPIESSKRRFAPGSVAFLSACSAAKPAGDNQQILTRLNKDGIDAMVVSPFPVDASYGKFLARAAIQVVKQAYDNKQAPTLLEIFEKAAKKVADENPDMPFANMHYEFVVLGNYQIKLCSQ